jgi:hypothetical protein
LTAAISDQEIEDACKSGGVDWTAGFEFPVHAHMLRYVGGYKPLALAELAWGKRELAIKLLSAALCNGALLLWVQRPKNGKLIQIFSTQLRTTTFLREIIVGGEIRASVGELLEDYNGEPVRLSLAAFHTWLESRRPRPKPIETTSVNRPEAAVNVVEDEQGRRRSGRKPQYDWEALAGATPAPQADNIAKSRKSRFRGDAFKPYLRVRYGTDHKIPDDVDCPAAYQKIANDMADSFKSQGKTRKEIDEAIPPYPTFARFVGRWKRRCG